MNKPPVRPIRIEGDTAYVTLTRGYEAIIDAADIPLVEGWNWTAFVTTWTVYAMRWQPSGSKQSSLKLHRVIMDAPRGVKVDHINSNGLDNRRANLRLATDSENARNSRRRSDNTSGFKGVTRCKESRRWIAQISDRGGSRHIGRFDTPEAAHAAYLEAAARIYGDFARAS